MRRAFKMPCFSKGREDRVMEDGFPQDTDHPGSTHLWFHLGGLKNQELQS